MDERILRSNGKTLVEEVMEAVRRRIASRALAPGEKLPSIRRYAETMRVSKSTVVEAFERLVASGVVRSRPGSGFYVAGHALPLAITEIGPRLDREIDPLWVSRQSLEASPAMLMPGCGWLPAEWMPQAGLRRALRTLSRAGDSVLTDYGSPRGSVELRRLLARRMADHHIDAGVDQILLAESGTQAIDLLCRFLLEPGDTVLVDDPCYFNFHALLRAHRVTVVGVPYTPTGPDVALFAQALSEHAPRLYITNSALHNPTGARLSPVTAHRLLKLAEQHNLTIVEDDLFADFEHDPAPRLAAFDGLERVILIGSFSKTLSAAARCGYIAARQDWVEQLVDLKIAASFSGGRLAAELVLATLKDGTYRKHMQELRERLSRAMSQTGERLKAIGIVPWIEPAAGMFLWCRLPDGLDAAAIAREALAAGIVLAPGNVFSTSQSAGDFLRFNVAQSADPRIFAMLEKAMAKGT